MATITRRGDGQWQSKIRKKGYPVQSKTFATKASAEKWSRLVESEMDRGVFLSTNEAENTTFSELVERYKKEVLPSKKSQQDSLSRMKTVEAALGHLILAAITPLTLKEYRDYRLETVSSGSVRKELSFISVLLTICQKEWDIYLPRGNPVSSIRVPSPNKARSRRLEGNEEEKLMQAAREYGGLIADIIQIAINTGMRRSEITSLNWKNINLEIKTATLLDTKNGEDRTIPLNSTVVSILKNTPRNINSLVFCIKPDSISQAFERICERTGIENLRFHDLRHEATSRFFELGLNIMEVSSITGHKDLAMLKRYTHLKAEDLAKKLS
ncbi:MAG: site-specific integrase [Gammaproteobacteria bacterium]|nr:site-specific integrase [Gammaproteobacteria bacterium]MBL6998659.1 site-specific integrase [Gammaproteobacteria bacterium]